MPVASFSARASAGARSGRLCGNAGGSHSPGAQAGIVHFARLLNLECHLVDDTRRHSLNGVLDAQYEKKHQGGSSSQVQ